MTSGWPWERALPWIVIGSGAVALAWVAAHRTFLNFGAETDFLASFLPEARSLLQGEPLAVDVHLPGYPFALALARWALGDWVRGALFLSWLSAVAVLASSFVLFGRLFGRGAAWGSLGGLLCSGPFVIFAAQACSDMFFVALISLGLLLVEGAIRTGRGWRWFLAGGLVGAIVLTRSNGVTLLVLLGAPLLCATSWRGRLRSFGLLVLGTLAPLVAWAAVARATGSPLLPTTLDAELAMRYFAEGRSQFSAETMRQVDNEFDGIAEVLLRDPLRVARTYVVDLAKLAGRVLRAGPLVSIPWNVLALPGLLLLLPRLRTRSAALCLGAIALQVLLMNAKMFQPRYFLVAVPLLGAGVGAGSEWVRRGLGARWQKALVVGAFGALVSVGCRSAWVAAWSALHSRDKEIGEAVPAVQLATGPSDVVVARKPHIPFYAERQRAKFPVVATVTELERGLRHFEDGRGVYVYFGWAEWRSRPALRALARPDAAPSWLTPVATSKVPGRWVLYRLEDGAVARDGSP